jgi:outer membrane protein OmpA-like peptidoglycan-associated protein
MIRALSVHPKWLLVAAVLVAALWAVRATAANAVETYTDDAVPPTSGIAAGQPLSAGDLTMDDVLKAPSASNKKTPPPLTSAPSAPSAAVAPQLKPQAKESAASVMLLQGMQSALRQAGVNPATPLQAPKLPSDREAAAEQPAANVVYQPGRAPINLAAQTDAVLKKATAGEEPSESQTAEAKASVANGTCTPQTSNWIKSCLEAGYPENFKGQIRGETRTTCPDGNLHDVWIANGCVPPEEAQTAEAASSPLTAPSSSSPAPEADGEQRKDASCGGANGLAANARPVYDLCAAGAASSVSGDGPWRWNCQGVNGGIMVSCASPVAVGAMAPASAESQKPPPAPVAEDAQCGSADGAVAESAPSANLCVKGMASRVNGAGPWTWACSGLNGGHASACSAPKKTDGYCGPANGSSADRMPMADLCVAGYASAVTGSGPWNWTCSGLNGGQAATCAAAPKTNAVCGSASLTGRHEAPKNALCSVGQASDVTGSGPWKWTCSGLNGGASVSCEVVASVNGACGLAHGTSATETPSDNLCSTGKTSRVTGKGPWSWTCSGSDGGDTASCTATRAAEKAPAPVPPVAAATPSTPAPAAEGEAAAPAAAPVAEVTPDVVNLCGAASEVAAIEVPSKNLCKAGSASSISGHGPWSWTCSDKAKRQTSSCATLSPTAEASEPAPAAEKAAKEQAPPPSAPVAVTPTAICGAAAGQGATQEPSEYLCVSGKASAVHGNGPWNWTCAKGKSHASCEAPKIADGACGRSNGTVLKRIPVKELCSEGTPTQVQGTGPWLWSCVGSGGGSSISCSAASEAQARVDGSCGAAANTSVAATPAANLCDSGVASSVYGGGPWTWTCSGLNGGIAASCSATKNTPLAPPPPGPAVNGLCGSANGSAMAEQPMDNLCSAGTATAVSGNGPWNWNCIGENSGMTVSCTAPLQPPAPVSGVCGQGNGVPTLTKPKSGLCSAGISSAVSGQGPWTWSCSGVNGGNAVGCVAPFAGNDKVGSLPSMVTTPDRAPAEAPAPHAAPPAPAAKQGLVTPRLPTGSLPPLTTGNLPPPPNEQETAVPIEAPQLPEDTQGVTPPPVRDMIQPAPALRSDESGNVLPGNHFVLDADIATIHFQHGSDNFDTEVVPILDKLAGVLLQNRGVRITLTAYADNAGTTPREARRLSLSRALAIRDYLTAKGVSSSRIDVRALGANVPSGDRDRVDVKAN